MRHRYLVLLTIAPKKMIFSNTEFHFWATWAIEAHSKVPPTDFCFRIALDFVENGPLLYLPSGYTFIIFLVPWADL